MLEGRGAKDGKVGVARLQSPLLINYIWTLFCKERDVNLSEQKWHNETEPWIKALNCNVRRRWKEESLGRETTIGGPISEFQTGAYHRQVVGILLTMQPTYGRDCRCLEAPSLVCPP